MEYIVEEWNVIISFVESMKSAIICSKIKIIHLEVSTWKLTINRDS